MQCVIARQGNMEEKNLLSNSLFTDSASKLTCKIKGYVIISKNVKKDMKLKSNWLPLVNTVKVLGRYSQFVLLDWRISLHNDRHCKNLNNTTGLPSYRIKATINLTPDQTREPLKIWFRISLNHNFRIQVLNLCACSKLRLQNSRLKVSNARYTNDLVLPARKCGAKEKLQKRSWNSEQTYLYIKTERHQVVGYKKCVTVRKK